MTQWGTLIHFFPFFQSKFKKQGRARAPLPHHGSDQGLLQSLASGERAALLSTFLLSKFPKAGSQHKQKHLLGGSAVSATYVGWEQWKKSSLVLLHTYPGYQKYPRTLKEILGYPNSVAALLAQLCNRIYLNAVNFAFVSRCRCPKQRVEYQIFITKK